MKKFFFIASGFIFLGMIPHVLAAQNFIPLAGIPGLTQNVPVSSAGLATFFNNLYKYLIGLAAILAVIEIIWGGIEYSTQDSISKKSDGKKRITQAILGLVLVLSPVIVFSIINPSILNLSLNLPPIKPVGQATSTPSGTAATQQTAPVTGCKTVTSGSYIETAICSSQNSASAYDCKNGLKLTVPLCKTYTSTTPPVCADTSVSVYCNGKTLELAVYNATYFFGLIGGWSSTITPRDAQAESAYASGCTADGGKVKKFYPDKIPCTADMSIPNYSTTNQSGVECGHEEMTCTP